jgi:hypothetical protein
MDKNNKNKDLIEIIFSDKIILFIENDIDKAEKFLNNLRMDIRLDLHGVLDLLENNKKIINIENDRKNYIIGAISYVGRLSNTRNKARQDIQNRIISGQINYGILIFKRGKRKKNKKIYFIDSGSKAWVNKNLLYFPNIITLYIDDGIDHIESTKFLLNLDNKYKLIKIFLFKNKQSDELLKIINNEILHNKLIKKQL